VSQDDYYEDYDEDAEWEEELEAEIEGDCPLGIEGFYCDPTCPFWMGDGLCEILIEEQAQDEKDYDSKHVHGEVCPVCGKALWCYEVKASELWTWDPSWHDPLIALKIFGPYDAPRGVIHSSGDVYHIWVGDEREEKLIKLIKEEK